MKLRLLPTLMSLALLGSGSALAEEGDVSIQGELKQWHKVTVALDGPEASEDGATNPFTDYRMTVTFTKGSTTIVVPGYFAADGNAAESSATSGNKWFAHLCPPETGTWSYEIDFTSGSDVAINGGGSDLSPFDGVSGNFSIAESDKSGVDFRAPGKGRLEYIGEHALSWQGGDGYFFKVGMNHPEVFLEYEDFDNTSSSRDYSDHSGDYNSGDPTWKSGKGSEIVGVVNYLSEQGMNVQYFLTMNTQGDGKKAYPWNDSEGIWEYDVSKMAQWGIVFDHMMAKGVMTHFVLDERENQTLFEYLDASSDTFADSRKLYYREMVARFGYLNAITWNIGEESGWQKNTTYGKSISSSQRIERAQYIRDLVHFEDHIVVHNGPSDDDGIFAGLLGAEALTGPSYQGNLSDVEDGNERIAYWRQESASNGHKWVVTYDEPYTSGKPKRDNWRKDALWASIAGGAAGAEIYSSGDTSRQDWRDFSTLYPDMKRAKEFLLDNDIPFWGMQGNNDITSRGMCLALEGYTYLIYLPSGGSPNLDLSAFSDDFTVEWFDPRNDGGLQNGSITSVTGGSSSVSLGNPPSSTSSDWVVLVRVDNGGENQAPIVDAGSDTYAIVDEEIKLGGSAFDPESDPLTLQWTAESGPGTVTFADDTSISTKVSFSAAGTYVLKLSANDGALSDSDTVSIEVSEANNDIYFEDDGILLFEVESAPLVSGWNKATTIEDYKGSGYYIGTINSFSSPGGGLLEYTFEVTNAGAYQLQWRSYIGKGSDTTEHNDSFARMVDSSGNPIKPNGSSLDSTGDEWYKAYMNTKGKWHWQASNVDGKPKALVWDLAAGETYTFQISVRSEGHAIDRVLLWNRDGFGYNFGNNKGHPSNTDEADALSESLRGGDGNKTPTVDAGSDQSVIVGNDVDLNATTSDPDGDAITLQWTKESGPGDVTFADATAEDTTVSISEIGTYVLKLEANDGELTRTDTVTINIIADPGPVVVAIDVGGDGVVSEAGIEYEADRGFANGKESSTNNAIDGTIDDEIYQTSRWHDPLEYALSVPNGSYNLVIHLSENYHNGANKRVFDIEVEGVLAVDDLDIFEEAGGKHIAHDITIPVTISDGELTMSFPASIDNASITGFRLEQADTSETRTITMTNIAEWIWTSDPSGTESLDGDHTVIEDLDPDVDHELSPVPSGGL